MGNHKPIKGCSSRFKGVVKVNDGKWVAKISLNSKSTYLGTFYREEDAAAAYAKAANDHFKEYARVA